MQVGEPRLQDDPEVLGVEQRVGEVLIGGDRPAVEQMPNVAEET